MNLSEENKLKLIEYLIEIEPYLRMIIQNVKKKYPTCVVGYSGGTFVSEVCKNDQNIKNLLDNLKDDVIEIGKYTKEYRGYLISFMHHLIAFNQLVDYISYVSYLIYPENISKSKEVQYLLIEIDKMLNGCNNVGTNLLSSVRTEIYKILNELKMEKNDHKFRILSQRKDIMIKLYKTLEKYCTQFISKK